MNTLDSDVLKNKHTLHLRLGLCRIVWNNQDFDWPWFDHLDTWVTNGKMELLLRGADYPDGSAKHKHDKFWTSVDEIKQIDYVVPFNNEAPNNGSYYPIEVVPVESTDDEGRSIPVVVLVSGMRHPSIGWYNFAEKKWRFYSTSAEIDEYVIAWTYLPDDGRVQWIPVK